NQRHRRTRGLADHHLRNLRDELAQGGFEIRDLSRAGLQIGVEPLAVFEQPAALFLSPLVLLRAQGRQRRARHAALYCGLGARAVFGSPSIAAIVCSSGGSTAMAAVASANGSLRPSSAASTSVRISRSEPRASRCDGKLSSWTTSTPSSDQVPSPGRSVTV